jgi:IS605 OrfB family transposase
MKLTANLKLNPTEDQFAILKQTLEITNQACNYISEIAFENKAFNQFSLQKIVYYEVKNKFKLSAQMTVRSIAKVSDSYKVDKKSLHKFKSYSAQPYDDRIFRLMKDDIVSIWTLEGRQKIPFQCGDYQRRLIENQHGEVDLMFIRGSFYIAIVCDVDENDMINPEDVLGIDLGIVNLAVSSEGKIYSGGKVDEYRRKISHRRKNLQKKGTKSAKRKLKKISGKQLRYQKDINHCISKAIVADAKRLSCAIALENLKGIRNRIKARKRERARLHNWAFYKLREFINYKAKLIGIPVIFVNPKNTSKECPICHHIEKSNRESQIKFACKSCGFSHLADFIASLNIRDRALVNVPMVSIVFND